MLLLANFAKTIRCKNAVKWLKPWHMNTLLRVLCESYRMSTDTTWFRWLSKYLRLCVLDESSLSIEGVNIPGRCACCPDSISCRLAHRCSHWTFLADPLAAEPLNKEKATTCLLNLSMLRLLLSKAKKLKNLRKSLKPYHLGINWKALIAYSQMSSHLPGDRSFFYFFHVILYWSNYPAAA